MAGLRPGESLEGRLKNLTQKRGFTAFKTLDKPEYMRYTASSIQRADGRRGVAEFRFTWLVPGVIPLAFDPAVSALTFDQLLPGVARASPLLAEVQEFIGSRSAARAARRVT